MQNSTTTANLEQAATLVAEAIELLQKSAHHQSNFGVICQTLQDAHHMIDAELDY